MLADGRRLVVLGESPQVVIDLATGARTEVTTRERVYSGAAAPAGGRIVVVGGAGYGAIIDVDRGTAVELGAHHLDFNTARFAPDGVTVATAGEDG
jgi:hypothetical protein